MPATKTDTTALAKWYAREHLKTDPGLTQVYYLPTNSPEREIRLLEVNDLIAERIAPLEPFDLGVDVGTENAHALFVLDVTPRQWGRIQRDELALPNDWSLENAKCFGERRHE